MESYLSILSHCPRLSASPAVLPSIPVWNLACSQKVLLCQQLSLSHSLRTLHSHVADLPASTPATTQQPESSVLVNYMMDCPPTALQDYPLCKLTKGNLTKMEPGGQKGELS